jgi:hypothetical protein
MTQQHDAPEGGLTMDVMASRLLLCLDGLGAGGADAENILAYVFTGRLNGPARNAALAEVLPRLAPTPPAPSGLVDAVHRDADGWWFWTETQADREGPYPDEATAHAKLSFYNHLLKYGPLGLPATLSDQQGGAVPAGDEIWPGFKSSILQAADKARTEYLRDVDANDQMSALALAIEAAFAERARLAEQPAPAGKGEGEGA